MDIFEEHAAKKRYEQAVQELRMTASRVIDLRAKEYMRNNESVDYRTAMYAVLNADPELKAAYLGHVKSDD